LSRKTEAVFSSSEDRIRINQAVASGSGPSIVLESGWAAGDHSRSPQKSANNGYLRTFSRKIADGLFTILFPSDCRLCGEPLAKISRLPVCQECLDAIHPIEGGLCVVCGERIFSPYAVSSSDQPRCGLCRRVEPVFARALAFGSYEGELRELVHLLKYDRVRPASTVLGLRLSEAIAKIEPQLPAGIVPLIPVPLYHAKRRWRGFNQAELIAHAAMRTGSLRGRFNLHTDVLIRKRDTASQIGLTSHQRRENLRGAFGIKNSELVRSREVLLVDDVFTTGATVSECARVLRRAGAAKVWVATAARTLKMSAQYAGFGPHRPEAEDDEATHRRSAQARGIAGSDLTWRSNRAS
jgi:ComF family protein